MKKNWFITHESFHVSIQDSFLLFTIHKGEKFRDTRFSRFKNRLSSSPGPDYDAGPRLREVVPAAVLKTWWDSRNLGPSSNSKPTSVQQTDEEMNESWSRMKRRVFDFDFGEVDDNAMEKSVKWTASEE